MSALKTFFILAIIWMFSSGWTQQINKDSVVGIWLTSKGECKIQIYERNGKYFGKIIWLKEPNDENGNPLKDSKNPNPKLRKRASLGIELLKNFRYTGKGKWSDGTIYNLENGKTYHAQMKMRENNRLDLKGYIGIPAFGLTSHWTRIK